MGKKLKNNYTILLLYSLIITFLGQQIESTLKGTVDALKHTAGDVVKQAEQFVSYFKLYFLFEFVLKHF